MTATCITVTGKLLSSKIYGSIIPNTKTPFRNIFIVQFFGFSFTQMQLIRLFTEPFKQECVSSDINDKFYTFSVLSKMLNNYLQKLTQAVTCNFCTLKMFRSVICRAGECFEELNSGQVAERVIFWRPDCTNTTNTFWQHRSSFFKIIYPLNIVFLDGICPHGGLINSRRNCLRV